MIGMRCMAFGVFVKKHHCMVGAFVSFGRAYLTEHGHHWHSTLIQKPRRQSHQFILMAEINMLLYDIGTSHPFVKLSGIVLHIEFIPADADSLRHLVAQPTS